MLLISANNYNCKLLCSNQVEDDLEKVKNASSQSELIDNYKMFGRNATDLMTQAAKRQQELKDPQLRDDLAAARAILKKHSTMLLTASKVCRLYGTYNWGMWCHIVFKLMID